MFWFHHMAVTVTLFLVNTLKFSSVWGSLMTFFCYLKNSTLGNNIQKTKEEHSSNSWKGSQLSSWWKLSEYAWHALILRKCFLDSPLLYFSQGHYIIWLHNGATKVYRVALLSACLKTISYTISELGLIWTHLLQKFVNLFSEHSGLTLLYISI